MIATGHKHQMRTGAACGEHASGGGMRRFTPAAHKAQGRAHPRPVGAHRTSRWFDAPRKLGGGLNRSRLFFHSFAHRATLHGLSNRRPGSPSLSRAATNSCGAIVSGSRTHSRLQQHITCQGPDAFEGHLSRPFGVTFYTTEHGTDEGQKIGYRSQIGDDRDGRRHWG